MWFRKKVEMPYKEGLIQASTVYGYIVLFTLFIRYASKLFPDDNQIFAPILFLTMFSFSVLACGLMVFYKPYMLFVDNKGKQAMRLVLTTTKWLGVFAVITFTLLALFS